MVERVVFAALHPMKEERVMSGPGFGLVIGAQTKAAGYVVDSKPRSGKTRTHSRDRN